MAKGGEFERDLSKRLSKWWTQDEQEPRDDVFWRSSNSGGRATTRHRQGKKTFGQYGDIQATDPCGQDLMDACVLELKRGYGKWAFLDVVDRPKRGALQPFEKFMGQVLEDVDKAGAKWPVVIARRDQRQAVIIFPKEMYTAIKNHGKCIDHKETSYLLIMSHVHQVELVCIQLDAFFDWCNPNFFKDRVFEQCNQVQPTASKGKLSRDAILERARKRHALLKQVDPSVKSKRTRRTK